MKKATKKIFIILLSLTICIASLPLTSASATNINSDEFYSTLTSELTFMRDDVAKSFIGFIYNVNLNRVSDEMKSMDDIFNYLTGRISKDTKEYEYAQAAFLLTSSAFINQNIKDSQNVVNISSENLIGLLEKEIGENPNPANDVANLALDNVKSRVLKVLYYAFNLDNNEIIADLELALSTYNTVSNIPEKVETFASAVQITVNSFFYINSTNIEKTYNYYAVYLNNRYLEEGATAKIGILKLLMDTYEIGNISDFDGIPIFLEKLGFGNSWTSENVQQLLRIFAEFTYHSQKEFKLLSNSIQDKVDEGTEEDGIYCDGVWKYIVVDNYAVLVGVSSVQVGAVCGPPSNLGGYPLKIISGINCGALAGIQTNQFIIPQGVESITSSAFNTGLFTSIVIPLSLKYVDFNAFPNCYGFNTVYYEGTDSDWNNISIEYPGLSNAPLINATRYYNYIYKSGELEYHNFEYIVNENDKTATITGYNGSALDLIIPSEIDGYSITEIGNNAFYGCKNLTNITIPNSTTVIGKYAFMNCTSLKSISFGNNITKIEDYAFVNCSSLSDLTILESVKSIGECAFLYCDGLINLTIRDGITVINDRAFIGCSSLTNVTIPNSVTTIGDFSFTECTNLTNIVIPNSITSISTNTFNGCEKLIILCYYGSYVDTYAQINNISVKYIDIANGYCGDNLTWSLNVFGVLTISGTGAMYDYYNAVPWNEYIELIKSIKIEDNVKTIGDRAFYNCNLKSVSIGSNVNSIGEMAFANCGSLKSITIPDNVTTIETRAFSSCSSLMNVSVGDGVKSIGNGAFLGCVSLTNILFGNNVIVIEDEAFYGCSNLTDLVLPNSITTIGKCAFGYCENLTNMTIPYNVTQMGLGMFCGCKELNNITILDGVTTIGSGAFSICDGLINITLPESITTIETGAFAGCNNLTSIIIPKKVTSIARNAFTDCANLTSITIPKSVTSIGEGAFGSFNNLTISCYRGSYADIYAQENGIPVKYIGEEEPAKADVFVFKTGSKNAYYINEKLSIPIGASIGYYSGKAYVPFRAIAAAVGINDLKFDSATNAITFTGAEGYKVKMTVGSTKCELTAPDGNKMSLTIGAPVNLGGSTCLPIREVSVLTGGSVKFDESGYILVSPETVDDEDIADYINAYKANIE